MNLTTTYMGLDLKNPIIPSASPLSRKIDSVKQMEDAGAAAIVVYSLFEEQIRDLLNFEENKVEAVNYFPESKETSDLNAVEYLKHISKLKKSVDIPVIASLNGITADWWTKYAKVLQEAGADAIELNIYYIPTDLHTKSEEIEQLYLDNLRSVKDSVNIPVAMKLNPFFSSLGNMAMQLDEAGVDALVLFNRFYQPDIDIEKQEVVPHLELSKSYEIRLPLRWAAILHGKIKANLAITTGVHTAEDVIKAIMVGADVAMMASVLLQNGISTISDVLADITNWMEKHEYESIKQLKGIMGYQTVKDPEKLIRANYRETLENTSSALSMFLSETPFKRSK